MYYRPLPSLEGRIGLEQATSGGRDVRLCIAGSVLAMTLAFGGTAALAAEPPIVVTPTATQGWTTADSTPGGAVGFVSDATAPLGAGALQLTTDTTTAAKAQYMHPAATALADVSELSYQAKQVAPATAPDAFYADPSYQLTALLNGTTGFTTLVFEPYQNAAQGSIVNNTWQRWDVAAGVVWSTRTVTCSNGTLVPRPAMYTLAQIKSTCPDAVVTGYGVNIGSNNPSYNVETDAFDFNGTVYDFEPYQVATTKSECKHGGWATLRRADGSSFKNQGSCVRYVNAGHHHEHGDHGDGHGQEHDQDGDSGRRH